MARPGNPWCFHIELLANLTFNPSLPYEASTVSIRGSVPVATMVSADFSAACAPETSPGKNIFLPPITAWSTISVFNPCGTFWTSQWCACLSNLIASYQVPVRQYRVLPVGFLHCIPLGKPACHLLTVRGVTPARKGLTPSGIISCYTLPFIPENLYFNHFFRAFSSVCTCSCWAHTFCKFCGGLCSTPAAVFRMLVCLYSDRETARKSAT
jgi:hypothetical protein